MSLSERFWSKVDKRDECECWEWKASLNNKGYGTFGVGGGKTKMAHRVAWELTFGAIPGGMNLLHSCDNPKCVNPKHLFTGTQQDNINDMLEKSRGNWAQGAQSGKSILTEEEVRDIITLGDYLFPQQLANIYNVTPSCIGDILLNKTWKCLGDRNPTAGRRKGETNNKAKLTEEQVLAIRTTGRNKTLRELAELYSVSMSAINRILLRKSWEHI